MNNDTTRGYKRWLRAMNNAKLRPHTEAAQLFRSRVEKAEAVNELTGFGSDSALVQSWTDTRHVPIKGSATSEWPYHQYKLTEVTVREYYCSHYCAALAVQIGRGSMSPMYIFDMLEDRGEHAQNARPFSRVTPGSSHRAAHCRTCNAKIKDGRVTEAGHDITVPIAQPLPTKKQIKKDAAEKIDTRDEMIARLKAELQTAHAALDAAQAETHTWMDKCDVFESENYRVSTALGNLRSRLAVAESKSAAPANEIVLRVVIDRA